MDSKAAFIIAIIACAAFLAFIALHRSAGTAAFFAYGTDLETGTMKARAGGFVSADAARADGYSVAFQSAMGSKSGTANLVPDAKGSAPGAVYRLTPEQMQALEKAEGAPGFYAVQRIEARLANGSTVEAATHVLSGSVRPAAPSRPTMLAISTGLSEFGYKTAEQDALANAASEAGR